MSFELRLILLGIHMMFRASWTLDHSISKLFVQMNEFQMVGPFDSEQPVVRYLDESGFCVLGIQIPTVFINIF